MIFGSCQIMNFTIKNHFATHKPTFFTSHAGDQHLHLVSVAWQQKYVHIDINNTVKQNFIISSQ